MPYKNPNPGARRSFGIRVVNIGRYRMLKDMETNKILKTKSEVSALQEFIDWLKVAAAAAECKDGVLLACHEPTRKVLVPLLLEAVNKYNLVADFTATVKGFVNTVHAVHKFGNMEKITSMSLRSLCKTVLDNTNPSTNNASDRSKVLIDILVKLTDQANNAKIDAGQVSAVAVTVDSEQADLTKLKEKLVIQGTLRPIFVSMLRKRRALKERAMALRSLVAESNVDYAKLNEVYESAKKTVNETVTKKVEQEAAGDAAEKTEEVEVEVVVEKVVVDLDKVKADLTEKVGKKVGEEDIAFLADLMESHFNLEKRSAAEAEAKEEARNNPRNFNNRRGGGGRGGRGGRGRGRGGGYRGGDRGNNKKPVPVSATEATPSESTC